jgi:hypothetical protein
MHQEQENDEIEREKNGEEYMEKWTKKVKSR